MSSFQVVGLLITPSLQSLHNRLEGSQQAGQQLMSGKITLESRQRLPSKIQDVICDSALVIQHATTASGSSDLLTTSAKQICATEQFVNATNTTLNKLDALLDAMGQQYGEIEEMVPVVSDMVATVQSIERNKYFTEEGRLTFSESDVDSTL